MKEALGLQIGFFVVLVSWAIVILTGIKGYIPVYIGLIWIAATLPAQIWAFLQLSLWK